LDTFLGNPHVLSPDSDENQGNTPVFPPHLDEYLGNTPVEVADFGENLGNMSVLPPDLDEPLGSTPSTIWMSSGEIWEYFC
jgi:hypothetical protein